MVVNVDLGERVKIKAINFEGNEVFNDKKLRSKLKKTKQKLPLRFWKKSKFIEEDFEEGKQNLLVKKVDKVCYEVWPIRVCNRITPIGKELPPYEGK